MQLSVTFCEKNCTSRILVTTILYIQFRTCLKTVKTWSSGYCTRTNIDAWDHGWSVRYQISRISQAYQLCAVTTYDSAYYTEPSKAIDAVNFRNIKESKSFDMFSGQSDQEQGDDDMASDDSANPFANFSSGKLKWSRLNIKQRGSLCLISVFSNITSRWRFRPRIMLAIDVWIPFTLPYS